jgi:L-fucose mutarotase/ribose pyranase (RbsD/FucU family)
MVLAKSAIGILLPLHILIEAGEPTFPAHTRQNQLLPTAEMITHAAVTKVITIGRIDESIDKRIARVAEEKQASVIHSLWMEGLLY